MGTNHLMTQAEFARIAGVKRPTINNLVKPGRPLAPAYNGTHIDASHRAAKAYLKKHADRPSIPEPVKTDTPRGGAAKKIKEKASEAKQIGGWTQEEVTENLQRLAVDIRALADKSLNELVEVFGTDMRFIDWLKSVKEIELIAEKRLKNAEREGVLVNRELVEQKVINVVDQVNIKLMTDGAKTIGTRTINMRDAGRDKQAIIQYVRDQLSSHVKTLKRRLLRGLNASSS